MSRSFLCSGLVVSFLCLTAFDASAQMQMASLHPNNGLVWQRTSPTVQKPDGPVLYQLLFNANGTPGRLVKFDTNPRHLNNSLISDNGSIVAIGPLSINGSSGVISFAANQTFPGLVSSVGAGNSFITIGGTGSNPTVSFNTLNGDGRYLILNGGTMTGKIVFAAGQTFPGTGSGTITGVTAGTGLTGGGTSGSVTLSNTGLLSLGISAPLSSTGGQSPTLSLGTVPIAKGGTGITTGPTAGGQYLRSTAAGAINWGDIVAGDLPSLSGTYVDLGSTQTISGNKTFTGNLNGNNASFGGGLFNGLTISGNLNGNTATFTGNITGNNATYTGGTFNGLTISGTLTGNTATFTGNITGNNASLNGGTFMGNLNGNTASFTGNGSFGGSLTPAGGLQLPSIQSAISGTGFSSEPFDLSASSFNSAAGAAVNQRFRWQAEPTNNNTGTASGSLNLLFAGGANPLAETGLSIASNGVISFSPAQTFPAAGVSSVTAGNGFITIGGTGSNPTVGFNTASGDGRYLKLTGGTLTGNLNGAGASFTGNLSGNNASFNGGTFAALTLSGTLNGAGATFAGDVNGANATFTGGLFTGGLTVMGGSGGIAISGTGGNNASTGPGGDGGVFNGGSSADGASFGGRGIVATGGTNAAGTPGNGGVFIGADSSNAIQAGKGLSAQGGNNTSSGISGSGGRFLGGSGGSSGGIGIVVNGGSGINPLGASTGDGGAGISLNGGSANGAGHTAGDGIDAVAGSASGGAAQGLAGKFTGNVTINGNLTLAGSLTGLVLNGDVTGSSSANTLAKIQGVPLAVGVAPLTNQALVFSGSPGAWHPAPIVNSISAPGGGPLTVSPNTGAASISLTGIVPILNGGTGIATVPAAPGLYLRSPGPGTWAIAGIQAADVPALPYWTLGGNANTGCGASPCAEFLGTLDGSAMEFGVSSQRAYRIEPAVDTQFTAGVFSPNLIGGSSANVVNGAGTAGATIGGGAIPGAPNIASASFTTIGGGYANQATGLFASVGGGSFNAATNLEAAVGGGAGNIATGSSSTVSGGFNNNASGIDSVVSGGISNFVTGANSLIAGGSTSEADGPFSAVAGGQRNFISGKGSFAAGQFTSDSGDAGTFLWGDNSTTNTLAPPVGVANQFLARAAGGVTFWSSAAMNTGVTLASGSGAWANASDRNLKEHFIGIDRQRLLNQVLALPITTWNYKSQDSRVHHIGPVAQDFYSAFNVGEDDRHITSIDESGVALAAIQGLNQKLEEQLKKKDAQIAEQQNEISALREALDSIRSQVARLETAVHTDLAKK